MPGASHFDYDLLILQTFMSMINWNTLLTTQDLWKQALHLCRVAGQILMVPFIDRLAAIVARSGSGWETLNMKRIERF